MGPFSDDFRPAFAITINNPGQFFDHVGLYISLSRVTSIRNISVGQANHAASNI